jgi:hypothetical protein
VAGLAIDASDGSIVVAGSFAGQADLDPTAAAAIQNFPTDTVSSTSVGRPFVSRLDPNGNPRWTVFYDGGGWPGGDQPPLVATGLDHSVFLAGDLHGTVDFDPGPGQDLRTAPTDSSLGYVTKLSEQGEEVFTWTLDGARVAHVVPFPHGELLVYGSFEGKVDFDPGPASDVRSARLEDAFLVMLNEDGTLDAPAVTFGGAGGADVRLARTNSDSSLFFSGTFSNGTDLDPTAGEFIGQVDPTSGSSAASYMAALNPDGTFAWAHTYEKVDLFVLEATADYEFVGGTYDDGADLDPGPGRDIQTVSSDVEHWFLSKLDRAGNRLWTRRWLVSGGYNYATPFVAFDDGSITACLTYGAPATNSGADNEDFLLPTTSSSRSVALLAFSPDGGMRSIRTFANQTPAVLAGCSAAGAAPDDTLVIAGTASGAFSVLDLGTLDARSGTAGYIARTTAY